MSVSPKNPFEYASIPYIKHMKQFGLRDEYFYCITDLEIFCVLNFKTVFGAFLTKFSERYNPNRALK